MVDKVRATTLDQHFGFQDSDLKTTQHDAIMVWLTTNIDMVLQLVIPPKTKWDLHYFSSDETKAAGDPPAYPGWSIKSKSVLWEQPIVTGKNFIAGFLDMVVEYEIPDLGLIKYQTYPLTTKWDIATESGFAVLEVKASIPSAGELIRQINMYRQLRPATHYIVVSPDDRFASVLESQGILYCPCPDMS